MIQATTILTCAALERAAELQRWASLWLLPLHLRVLRQRFTVAGLLLGHLDAARAHRACFPAQAQP